MIRSITSLLFLGFITSLAFGQESPTIPSDEQLAAMEKDLLAKMEVELQSLQAAEAEAAKRVKKAEAEADAAWKAAKKVLDESQIKKEAAYDDHRSAELERYRFMAEVWTTAMQDHGVLKPNAEPSPSRESLVLLEGLRPAVLACRVKSGSPMEEWSVSHQGYFEGWSAGYEAYFYVSTDGRVLTYAGKDPDDDTILRFYDEPEGYFKRDDLPWVRCVEATLRQATFPEDVRGRVVSFYFFYKADEVKRAMKALELSREAAELETAPP